MADARGFEPLTIGSGERRKSQRSHGFTADRGPSAATARRLLGAVARGAPITEDDLRELADGVLATADESIRLALELREGGPHRVRRAIELAALILQSATALEAPDLAE